MSEPLTETHCELEQWPVRRYVLVEKPVKTEDGDYKAIHSSTVDPPAQSHNPMMVGYVPPEPD